MKKPNGYWSFDKCIVEAKKFNTKNEWRLESNSSYQIAKRNEWIDVCSKHMLKLGSKFDRLIYSFEFPDKSVYVGLTCNPIKRKFQHYNDEESHVNKHMRNTNLKPTFKILSKYYNYDLASTKEGEFLKFYKKQGWKILNKKKTGGLGGNIIKWTKNSCINDAKKYARRSDWKKSSNTAYCKANKFKWMNECCAHMNKPWN